jgi:hypothetical protein
LGSSIYHDLESVPVRGACEFAQFLRNYPTRSALECAENRGSTRIMAKANAEWKVLAHEPVQKLAENLLWVRGVLPA